MSFLIGHLLLTTLAFFVVAVGLFLLISLGVSRIYPHAETKPQVISGVGSLVIAILVSVVLNYLWTEKRDEDNRLRSLRDQHFAQLKPVLHAEAENLRLLAQVIETDDHISPVADEPMLGFSPERKSIRDDPAAALWPDVLSKDLRQHFLDYDKSKWELLSLIQLQGEEFRGALSRVKNEIKTTRGRTEHWRELDALSFLLSEQCFGRADAGMTLTINGPSFKNGPSSFNFIYLWEAMAGSGPPPPEIAAAFRGFKALRPDAEVKSHCENLKARADRIQQIASSLSKEAQLHSEETILRGSCDFIRE